jgi:hypothetical protein
VVIREPAERSSFDIRACLARWCSSQRCGSLPVTARHTLFAETSDETAEIGQDDSGPLIFASTGPGKIWSEWFWKMYLQADPPSAAKDSLGRTATRGRRRQGRS